MTLSYSIHLVMGQWFVYHSYGVSGPYKTEWQAEKAASKLVREYQYENS